MKKPKKIDARGQRKWAARTIGYTFLCPVCKNVFRSKRRDALTDGPTCRKIVNRTLAKVQRLDRDLAVELAKLADWGLLPRSAPQ